MNTWLAELRRSAPNVDIRRIKTRRMALQKGLLILGLAVPSFSWAECKIQAATLPVTLVNSRAVATVGINGTQVPLIVDSGGFYSMLTPAAAQQLKLDIGMLPWGYRIEGLTGAAENAGSTWVKRLQLPGGEIRDIEFIVGGNAENGTMGLLGRNILSAGDTEYDLGHGVIRLLWPNADCDGKSMAYWADDKPVSELQLLRPDSKADKTPAIRATAQLNGKKLTVLFDTGAQSMVTLDAAKRAGLTDLQPANDVYGVGRGEVKAWTAAAERFELGGEAISHNHLRVADFEMQDVDMLLGIDFFLSHRIYVSKKQYRMYFTYEGGPVFTLNAEAMAKAAAAPAFAAASAPDTAASEAQRNDPDAPTDAAGYARRGAAYAARLDYAHALADLNRACEMAPQVAEYFVRRGVVHEGLRQNNLAQQDFDTAIRLEPAQAEARLQRARIYIAKRNQAGATEDLLSLDKTLTPQASERYLVAQLYMQIGLLERGLGQWDLWIAAHPDDVGLGSALNTRCWVRATLNTELDKALDDCDKAVDLQSNGVSYYGTRAWVQLRRNELRKALKDFDRELKMKPENAWSLYGRGIVHRKQGDSAAGQADLEAARKLQPGIDMAAAHFGMAADPAAPAAPPSAPAGPPAPAAPSSAPTVS